MTDNLKVTENMEDVMETPVTTDVSDKDPLMMDPDATVEILYAGGTYDKVKEVVEKMVYSKHYKVSNGVLIAKRPAKAGGSKSVSTNFEVCGFVGSMGSEVGNNFDVIIELYNAFLGKQVRVQVPRNISANKLEQVFCNNGAVVYDAKELRKALRIKDTAAMYLLQVKTFYDTSKPEKLTGRIKDALNGVGLPEVKYIHNCIGWKLTKDGKLSFLASKSINAEGVDSEYRGNFQIQPRGSMELYLAMVAKYICNNVPLLMMMAIGVSATVLGYVNRVFGLNILNPIVHLFGNSTTGKTTAAQLVASLGGLPETGRNASTFLTFNGTMNALIKKLDRNSGYPVCVDEFSMNTTRDISPMIYALVDGSEKERLSRDGSELQARSEFETVIVTNGEGSLLSCANGNEGLRTRIIELAMIQWTEDAESADEIKKVVSENYGFITPLVAKYLLRQDAEAVKALNEKYHHWYDKFVTKAHVENVSLNITERVSKILALFMLSFEIMLEILDENKGDVNISFEEDIINKAFEFFFENVIVAMAEDASIGIRAYNYLVEYYITNRDKFWDRSAGGSVTGCEAVVMDNRSSIPDKNDESIVYERSLCFPFSKAEELLVKKGKFSSVEVCMKEIDKMGRLMTHDKSRLSKRFVFGSEVCEGYRILLKDTFYELADMIVNGD